MTLIRKITSSLNRKKLDEQAADVKLAKAAGVKADRVIVPKIISSRLWGQISNKEFHHTDLKKGKTHVRSTAIKKVRYNPNNNHLYVTYTGGSKEYVFNVDENTFQKFMRAGSKGRFVQNVLSVRNRAPRGWYHP